ncbi:MAG TPA: DsbA family protein [Candidatus Saccharimonadales bacterium]|nr:DsbA family protein [Candidatus Saccharimonadales bacterium]
MKVSFYFDPCCPFCWITSRWLLMVSGERDVQVDWRPFSLALKNDEVRGGHDKTEHGDMHRAAHRVLRVMLAAQQKGASLIDLYTDFGIPYHLGGEAYDDALITKILAKHDLPPVLARAADDTGYDDALQKSIDTATAIAGDDIGVPTIIFTNQDGSKNGFFGPVLQQLPDRDEAVKLWDGLSRLASDKNFYELKRSRPSGDPDVYSTAKC